MITSSPTTTTTIATNSTTTITTPTTSTSTFTPSTAPRHTVFYRPLTMQLNLKSKL